MADEPTPPTTPLVMPPVTPPPGEPPKSPSPTPTLISGEQSQPPAEEWKEYVIDPAKSNEENLRLKAEHDKTKPGAAPPAPAVETVKLEDIKLPEGFSADEALMGKFVGVLNNQDLFKSPKALAQSLIDLQRESLEAAQEAGRKAWEGTIAEWQKGFREDPVVGGENFTRTVADANRIVKQFGDSELSQVLEVSGIGNHRAFARFMAKIAPKLLEPTPVPPGGAPQGERSQADRIYGT